PVPRTRKELARLLERRECLTFTHPTMIYQRKAAIEAGGYCKELEPCEDVDLFARLLAAGGSILIQPEVLTLYRVHAGSISQRAATQQFVKRHYVFHNFYAVREGLRPISYEAFVALRARRPLAERLA